MASFSLFLSFTIACGGATSPAPGPEPDRAPAPPPPAATAGAGSSASPSCDDSWARAEAAKNSPKCPATFEPMKYGGQACAPEGTRCWYPGAGDGDGNGCFAPGLFACQSGAWVSSQ